MFGNKIHDMMLDDDPENITLGTLSRAVRQAFPRLDVRFAWADTRLELPAWLSLENFLHLVRLKRVVVLVRDGDETLCIPVEDITLRQ